MPLLDTPLVVPAIRLDRDAEGEAKLALRRAARPWVAGFCLFGGEREAVADLVRGIREAAGRPIFIASDMERGAGQQVSGLPVDVDFGVLGVGASPDEVYDVARAAARDARSVGVDVLFSPVLDVRSDPHNPIIGTRAFSWDPHRVASHGMAYLRGAPQGGALPVAKHFPGHGATREDSHDAIPSVQGDARLIRSRDLHPFRQVIEAGLCPAVMTAHVAYPALDATGTIATFSKPIIDTLRGWGRHGESTVIITDALMMAGAMIEGGEVEAARTSLEAGCDILLYPDDPEQIAETLFDCDAARRDVLEQCIWKSAERVTEFVRRIPAIHASTLADAGRGERPDGSIARRTVQLLCGRGLHIRPKRIMIVDDDDDASRGKDLTAVAKQNGSSVHRFVSTKDAGVPDRFHSLSETTIVVFSRARAWKGVAGTSKAGQDLVRAIRLHCLAAGWEDQVIWCAPRSHGSGFHIPGMGPAIERAIAARLFP